MADLPLMGIDWQAGRGWLFASGKRLEYACFGPPPVDAPTLVMLHEGLGCVALWRDFPARLATQTGCGVFVYSRAGYGQSESTDLPRPLDYMTCEALDVLPEVLQQLAPQQVILIGHSDGATIVAVYAGRVADPRIRGLVLIAPHFFTEPEGLARIAEIKEEYNNTDLHEKLGKYHRDPDNCFRGWNDAWLDPEFGAWNVADVIDHFTVPVLAIQGRLDEYGTMKQVDVISQRSPEPVEVHMIDQCRHAPHVEQPQPTDKVVTGFVQKIFPIIRATTRV